ncbi:MAG: putative lipid II flippase FtsW [Candidatus Hydrogenedentes bacterium]|nr:putative lipid II flippase FtsW [Candidatus Hydrogenedentota bacterium]
MRRETIFVFTIACALVMIGLLMVYSANTGRAYSNGKLDEHVSYVYLYNQLILVGIGFAALLVTAGFDYHSFRNRGVLWLLVSGTLALLVLVLVFGDERRGGLRWLNILGFQFQPSELAKFALVILLAVKLSENQGHLKSFGRGFLPPMVITAVFAGLVLLEQDLGTPAIMVAVAMLMIILAGGRWIHVGMTWAPAAAVLGAMIVISPYRIERLYAFMDPWKFRTGKGLQLIESLAGFARGGLWGKGLGAGEQKLLYLPDAHSDFIFAVWGEEMGLVGTMGLILLFALLLFMAVRIAISAKDLFGSLLASGIVSLILVQATFNMGVTTGLLPTKGLVLPFISAGGSALIVNLAMIGVLINVGKQAYEREDGYRNALAA